MDNTSADIVLTSGFAACLLALGWEPLTANDFLLQRWAFFALIIVTGLALLGRHLLYRSHEHIIAREPLSFA